MSTEELQILYTQIRNYVMSVNDESVEPDVICITSDGTIEVRFDRYNDGEYNYEYANIEQILAWTKENK